MAEDTTQQQTTQQTTQQTSDTGAKDAAYWEAEAKRAFRDRDTFKQKARDLEGKVITDEQAARFKELEDNAAKAEEERKRKAGEFDTWRADILKKHQQDLADREKRAVTAEDKLRRKEIGLAFAAATDVFGKEAFTIYGPKAGERVFSDFVDLDGDGVVIVKNRSGHVILDAETGKPAPFSVGIRELIESLPDKNEHLRGSGKTGSGSSGGGQPGTPADITELTQRARNGDKAAIDALKQRRAQSGQLVMGTAFSR